MAVTVERLMWSSYGHGFSTILREVRRRREISQQTLAELSGLSRNQISNLERNENGPRTMADPALSTIYKLAWALEVPPAVLLPGSSDEVAVVFRRGTRDDAPSAVPSLISRPEDVAPFPQGYIEAKRFGHLRRR